MLVARIASDCNRSLRKPASMGLCYISSSSCTELCFTLHLVNGIELACVTLCVKYSLCSKLVHCKCRCTFGN